MITVSTREEFLGELKKHLPEHPICSEIGVLYGDFSALILDILNPKRLLLIDPYKTGQERYGDENSLPTAYSTDEDYLNITKRFAIEISSSRVVLLREYSYDAINFVADKSLDTFYIDASHLYKDVKRDLEMWFPKLKDDGVISGHDLIEDDVFGVIKAVDDFIEEHNFELIIFNGNGGDWALKKKQ